jgi:hypothetical protein
MIPVKDLDAVISGRFTCSEGIRVSGFMTLLQAHEMYGRFVIVV